MTEENAEVGKPEDAGVDLNSPAEVGSSNTSTVESVGTTTDTGSEVAQSSKAATPAAANSNESGGVSCVSAVDSTSDSRTVNNVMRHAYRVLSDEEKAAMQRIKDFGLEFHTFLETLSGSREISVAKTKIEEAVMWAVKHITK